MKFRLRSLIVALTGMFALCNALHAQVWQSSVPVSGQSYYLYSKQAGKFVNDADGLVDADQIQTTWTFSGSLGSFTLTSNTGKQFAVYPININTASTVATSATNRLTADRTLESNFDTQTGAYGIYRKAKMQNLGSLIPGVDGTLPRNVVSSGNGLATSHDNTPEWQFISVEDFINQPRAKWEWLGEEYGSDKNFYFLNNQTNTFCISASTRMTADIKDAGLFYLEPTNNGNCFLKNEQSGYLTWGRAVVALLYPLDVNRAEVYSLGNRQAEVQMNQNPDNNSLYVIFYDPALGGSDDESFLKVGDNSQLAKEDNVNMNNAYGDNHYNWKLISIPQKNVYIHYCEALEKAKKLLSLTDAVSLLDESDKQKLEDEVNNSTVVRNWKSLEVLEFIKLVASIDDANLSINAAAKYGTFIAPFNMPIPPGVSVYTVNTQPGTAALKLTPSSTIEAGTPYLVYGENSFSKTYYGKCDKKIREVGYKSNDGEFEFKNGGSIADFNKSSVWNGGATDLTGSLKKQLIELGENQDVYILKIQNGRTAFYHCDPNLEGGYTTGKNRCWLVIPKGSNIKTFSFGIDNDANSIDEVISVAGDKTIYDLQGRKVTSVKKGIYVVDGKKVMINK